MQRCGENVARAREGAVEGRLDLSRFVVHLTRDDRKDHERGWTARRNFDGIAKDRTVLALHPHCLHMRRIPEEHRERLSVCCFTETPLSELRLLTRRIPGRSIELSEYGFVFSREFLISKGAQPAIYVNSYAGNARVREAADRVYELAAKKDFCGDKLWRLVPYLNVMNEQHDFAWEREWRVAGDVEFAPTDVVCVILPENGEEKRKETFLRYGVPVISPGWSMERIVAEFSKQARSARRLWMAKRKRGGKSLKGFRLGG